MAKSWQELEVLSSIFEDRNGAVGSLMWGKILLLKYFAWGKPNSIGKSDPRVVKNTKGYMLFTPKAPTEPGQSISYKAFKEGCDYLLSVGYIEKKNIPAVGDKGGRTQIVFKLTTKLYEALSKGVVERNLDYDVGENVGPWNPTSFFLATLLLKANRAGVVRNLSQVKLQSMLGMKPGRVRSIRERLIKSEDIIFYSPGVKSGLLSQQGSIYLLPACFCLIQSALSDEKGSLSKDTHTVCFDFSMGFEYRQYKKNFKSSKNNRIETDFGDAFFWRVLDKSLSASIRVLVLNYIEALVFSYCLEKAVSSAGIHTDNLSLETRIKDIFNSAVLGREADLGSIAKSLGVNPEQNINDLFEASITCFSQDLFSMLKAKVIQAAESTIKKDVELHFLFKERLFYFKAKKTTTSE